MMRPIGLVLGLALAGGCFHKPAAVQALPEDTPAEVKPQAPKAPLPERANEAIAWLSADDPALYRKAALRLEELIAEAPDEARLFFNLGVARYKLDEFEAAGTAFERATTLDPSDATAWRYRGIVAARDGDPDQAIQYLRRGVAGDVEDMAIRVALVEALRQAGRPDEAISEARAALKINARDVALYNAMGLSYRDKGDFQLAGFVYEKALAIPGAESNPVIAANLGWTHYLEGDRYKARERLLKAVEDGPEFVPGLVYMARFYMDDRNYEDALPLLETAAKLAPDNHSVFLHLGIALRGVERFEDARAAYRRALEIDPSDPSPHLNLAILLGDYMKQYDAALAAFDEYGRAGGGDAEVIADYVKAVTREKSRAERLRKQAEERERRERDREERERLLEAQAAEQPAADPADGAGATGDQSMSEDASAAEGDTSGSDEASDGAADAADGGTP